MDIISEFFSLSFTVILLSFVVEGILSRQILCFHLSWAIMGGWSAQYRKIARLMKSAGAPARQGEFKKDVNKRKFNILTSNLDHDEFALQGHFILAQGNHPG